MGFLKTDEEKVRETLLKAIEKYHVSILRAIDREIVQLESELREEKSMHPARGRPYVVSGIDSEILSLRYVLDILKNATTTTNTTEVALFKEQENN